MVFILEDFMHGFIHKVTGKLIKIRHSVPQGKLPYI